MDNFKTSLKELIIFFKNSRNEERKMVMKFLSDNGLILFDKGDLLQKTFDDADGNPTERRIIFLRHKDAHMGYSEQMRSVNRDALELSTLEHYLQTSKAFLGICRAKKFNNHPYRCYMFDAAHLENVEFLLSVEVRSYKDGDTDGDGDGSGDGEVKKDLPF